MHLLGVVFIRNLPDIDLIRRYIRPSTCSILLDTLDMSPIYHKRACLSRAHVDELDAIIANNRASLSRVLDCCPLFNAVCSP